MNTTSFYVELVVIGTGVLLWVAMLFGAAFGIDPGTFRSLASWGYIVALLPLIYVFGIVADRCADWLFDCRWQQQLWGNFTSKSEIHQARRAVMNGPELIADLMEYGRSRLRICRGWAFNGPFLMVGAFVYGNSAGLKAAQLIVVELFLVGLTVLTWYSWRSLACSDYHKLFESWQAQLHEQKAKAKAE